jgi:predicted DNA-binding transcriptional regulator AlpA
MEATTTSEVVYIDAARVKRRYGGVSDMTLFRWLRDEAMAFPRPVYFNDRRRMWRLDELEDWEQARRAQPAPDAQPVGGEGV